MSVVDGSRHPQSFFAKLVAFGREYRLEASRHDALLHPDYGEYVVESDGSVTRTESTTPYRDHCHYHGVVTGAGGEHEGDAVLSICAGLRGQILMQDGTTLSIEPAHLYLPEEAPPDDSDDGEGLLRLSFIAFRREDEREGFRTNTRAMVNDVVTATEKKFKLIDAAGRVTLPPESRSRNYGGKGSVNNIGRRLTQAGAEELYVELIVVNDKKRVEMYGSATKSLRSDTVHVVSLVSALFKKLPTPVSILLVAQYENDSVDPWADDVTIESDGEANAYELLNAFTSWREKKYDELPSHNSAHLFSGHDFDGETLGLANAIGETGVSVCGDYWCGYDVGGSELTHGYCFCTGRVHTGIKCTGKLNCCVHGLHGYLHGAEIDAGVRCEHGGAWNWSQMGFRRDGLAAEGTQSCDMSKFIMAAVTKLGETADSWSQCTLDAFDERLKADEYFCLIDGSNPCGNRVVDDGEECDCGAADCSALDPCCDGSTCKLKAGAECSAIDGDRGCCDPATCSKRAAGHVCRPIGGLCDVKETCDGVKSTCPMDLHMEIGKKCQDTNDDVGACLGKHCSNRDRTCTVVTEDSTQKLYGGKSASQASAVTVGGQKMWVFDANSCDNGFICFSDAGSTSGSAYSLSNFGALHGFPCGTATSVTRTIDGVSVTYDLYDSVCDGGPNDDGQNSQCVARAAVTPPPPAPPPAPTAAANAVLNAALPESSATRTRQCCSGRR